MPRTQEERIQFSIEVNGEKKILESIKDVRKQRRLLQQQLEKGGLTADEYNKKVAEIAKLNGILTDHRKKLRGVGQTAKGLPKFFKGVGTAIKGAFAPLIALLAVGELLNAARAVKELTEEYSKLRSNLNNLSGESGDALSEQVVQVQALSRTFNQEQDAIVGAGQAAAKEFGQSYQNAFADIEKGLLLVGERGGEELLAQVDEYSAQFAQAGFSLQDTIQVIANGINEGVFTDKAADAVKEFGLIIQDLTKGQREILEQNFGKEYTDNLVAGIEDGSVSVKDALGDVSGQIAALDDQGRNVQPIIANLFGGAGIDAGVQFIKTLQNVNGTLDESIDTTNFYVQQQQQLLAANKELAVAEDELTSRLEGSNSQFNILFTQVKAFVFGVLVDLLDFITTLPQRIDVLRARLDLLGVQAGNLGKQLVNTFFGPVLGAIEAITGRDFSLKPTDTTEYEKSITDAQQRIEDKLAADEQLRAEERARTQAEADAKAQRNRVQRRTDFARQATSAEAEAMAKAVADMENKLADLRIAAMAEGEAKELAALDLQTQRRLDELKGTQTQIEEARTLIMADAEQDRRSIRQKYADEEAKRIKEAADQALAEQQAAYDRELAALEAQQQQRILAATQATARGIEGGEDPAAAEAKLKDELLRIEEEFLQDRIALGEEYGIDVTGLNQDLADRRLDRLRDEKEEELRIEEETAARKAQLIQQSADAVFAVNELIVNAAELRANKELAALEDQKQKELARVGDNADAQAKIEAKFAAQQEKIAEDLAKKKRRIAIGETIIRGALAIQRIAADVPKADFGITTALLIGAQVALTAAQVAAIKAQQFATGGRVRSDVGRIPVQPNGDSILATLKPGEVVLNQDQQAALGGSRTFQAIGVPGFAAGGAVTTPSQSVVNSTNTSAETAALLAKLDQLNVGLREQKIVLPVNERLDELNRDVQTQVDAARSRRSLD